MRGACYGYVLGWSLMGGACVWVCAKGGLSWEVILARGGSGCVGYVFGVRSTRFQPQRKWHTLC